MPGEFLKYALFITLSAVFVIGVWWERDNTDRIDAKGYGRRMLEFISILMLACAFVAAGHRYGADLSQPGVPVLILWLGVYGWYLHFAFSMGRATRWRVRDIGRFDDRWAYAFVILAAYCVPLAVLCLFRSKQPHNHRLEIPEPAEQ